MATVFFMWIVYKLGSWTKGSDANGSKFEQLKATIYSMTWWAEIVIAGGGNTYTGTIYLSLVLLNLAPLFVFG